MNRRTNNNRIRDVPRRPEACAVDIPNMAINIFVAKAVRPDAIIARNDNTRKRKTSSISPVLVGALWVMNVGINIFTYFHCLLQE